jgi:hypothetical protein
MLCLIVYIYIWGSLKYDALHGCARAPHQNLILLVKNDRSELGVC